MSGEHFIPCLIFMVLIISTHFMIYMYR